MTNGRSLPSHRSMQLVRCYQKDESEIISKLPKSPSGQPVTKASVTLPAFTEDDEHKDGMAPSSMTEERTGSLA